MAKTEYLIGKLKGQIEEWEEEISTLGCRIAETSEEDIKKECNIKIGELQSKITKAQDKIYELGKKPVYDWTNLLSKRWKQPK